MFMFKTKTLYWSIYATKNVMIHGNFVLSAITTVIFPQQFESNIDRPNPYDV